MCVCARARADEDEVKLTTLLIKYCSSVCLQNSS